MRARKHRVFRLKREIEDDTYMDPDELERAAQRCVDNILETIRNHMSPSIRIILSKEGADGKCTRNVSGV